MTETKNDTTSKKCCLSGLPDQMKMYDQWIVWRLENKAGEKKPAKIPYNPKSGERASSTDRKTWGTFTEAKITYDLFSYKYAGVGFVFNKLDPFIAIDIDHCIGEDGVLSKTAYLETRMFGSYTEISQSGTGLHIIAFGGNPGGDDIGHKKGDIEFYTHGRFFALTGNVYKDHRNVTHQPMSMLIPFYDHYFTKHISKPIVKTNPLVNHNVDLSDDKIIEICSNAKNSSKFVALWRGSTVGYNSGSEADMALTSMLAFYTQDTNQLQRLLLRSGLSREKMNRVDYITRTINKATTTLTETFKPKTPVCWYCKTEIKNFTRKDCAYCGKTRRY